MHNGSKDIHRNFVVPVVEILKAILLKMDVEISVPPNQNSAASLPQEELNLSRLADALRLCTDGLDPDKVQAGERVVQMYNNNKQFLNALVAILTDDVQPNDVKTMAAILCRNNIEKFWRAGPLMLDDKDKRQVRSRLFFACFAFPAATVSRNFLRYMLRTQKLEIWIIAGDQPVAGRGG